MCNNCYNTNQNHTKQNLIWTFKCYFSELHLSFVWLKIYVHICLKQIKIFIPVQFTVKAHPALFEGEGRGRGGGGGAKKSEEQHFYSSLHSHSKSHKTGCCNMLSAATKLRRLALCVFIVASLAELIFSETLKLNLKFPLPGEAASCKTNIC